MATADSIPQLVDRAKLLRTVRSASRRFLKLWAAERSRGTAEALFHAVVDPADELRTAYRPDDEADAALADPSNHDWTLLYRGSVLDD